MPLRSHHPIDEIRDKKGARGKDQTAGSSRACVPLGKDLFLAEKVGTRSTQVQPRKPWKACVTMLVCACGIRRDVKVVRNKKRERKKKKKARLPFDQYNMKNRKNLPTMYEIR